jgi:hypothetical protein
MRLKTFLAACFLVCTLGVSVFAVQGDPLTGTWAGDWGPTATHRNQVTLELKWDGKALTGNVNPGPNAIPLKAASFDPATGAIRMEAETVTRRGGAAHYVIEGKVAADGSMTGSWNHDNTKGDFKIAKR